jgi:4,5-dihydroxyphthalate decarboxylase
MSDIHLTFAMGENPRSRPVLTGAVKPEGIELDSTVIGPSELFWRQLMFHEFDVSEMSMSSLIITRAKGDQTWVALPIFTTRSFFHTGVLVRDDAGIDEPAQLAGARVGVPEYQQTAALWARGILQHEFGVEPSTIHWFMERLPELSHGGATGFTPPAGIDLEYIPAESDIGKMLQEGKLDAALVYYGRPPSSRENPALRGSIEIGRSSVTFESGSGVRTLFHDVPAEAARYYGKTGIFPINHCVVVRSDVVEKYPWVPLNIFDAFLAAKRIAEAEFNTALEPLLLTGTAPRRLAASQRTDVYPYGVQAQRSLLETIAAYSYEQGLTSRQVGLDELFYPPTLEL